MTYWIPAGAGAYCIYLGFLIIRSIIDEVKDTSWNSNFWETAFFVAIVGGIMIVAYAILAYIIYMSWLLLSALNIAIYMVIVAILTPFICGFTYCNAWRQGMSKLELEGKLAYIKYERETKKEELKARKEAKKEEKRRKKKEQYEKGYYSHQEKCAEKNKISKMRMRAIRKIKILTTDNGMNNNKNSNRSNKKDFIISNMLTPIIMLH